MVEYQTLALLEAGYRVITYDRRGYDTFADDFAAVIEACGVERVDLVGFAMGGGIARYLTRYGTARVSRAVLIASVVAYLLKTDDADASVFEDIKAQIR
jgi:non-heme chloroperoxidase